MKDHLVIIGGGRAGTTFLAQLLTRLGFETGMVPYDEPFNKEIRAGAEFLLSDLIHARTLEEIKSRFDHAPLIIKSPDLSFYLKPFLFSDIISVRHAIIPVRDHAEAALSRINSGLFWKGSGTKDFNSQADWQDRALGKAVEACVLANIPITFTTFPKIVKDWEYCYGRVSEALSTFSLECSSEDFKTEFDNLADPSMITSCKYVQELIMVSDKENPDNNYVTNALRLRKEEDGGLRVSNSEG